MSYYIKGKGYFESGGQKIGSKRTIALATAKVCGFENDSATFTRLIIESRVNRQLLNEQWMIGANMRKATETE